ncbi:hypothetical protein AVEN_146562-1 [Araneus ventricosus]|uniref:BED-type domain-containing protein n=1 Tax=Araneus ventricosus TaxID=182803 RepID=A0A4Y2SC48_ARAVE|nr:hypothetical protein AVEN_107714-1 [Araneus ventricosus]GBN85203.1 hypothetical protein AVEN_146562-1 [Araneus ventricosus]
MDTRKKSVVWNFFTLNDKGIAVCNICRNNFIYKSSATNFKKKHLQIKHPTVLLCHLDVSSHAVRPKANEPPAAAICNDDDREPISAVPIPMSSSARSFALPSTSSSASASSSSVTGTASNPLPSQRTQQPIKTSHQAFVESFLKRKLPLA